MRHSAAEAAALVGAGLLSVLLFPAIGLSLLRRGEPSKPSGESEPEAILAM